MKYCRGMIVNLLPKDRVLIIETRATKSIQRFNIPHHLNYGQLMQAKAAGKEIQLIYDPETMKIQEWLPVARKY